MLAIATPPQDELPADSPPCEAWLNREALFSKRAAERRATRWDRREEASMMVAVSGGTKNACLLLSSDSG